MNVKVINNLTGEERVNKFLLLDDIIFTSQALTADEWLAVIQERAFLQVYNDTIGTYANTELQSPLQDGDIVRLVVAGSPEDE